MHSRLLRVHLFTCDSLTSIFNKISKRWPRLQATWLIMIGFLKFELYGLSVYLCRSIRPETCERALAATAKASWRGD